MTVRLSLGSVREYVRKRASFMKKERARRRASFAWRGEVVGSAVARRRRSIGGLRAVKMERAAV